MSLVEMSNSYPANMNSNYNFYYGIITEIISLSDVLMAAQTQAGVYLATADITIPPVQAKIEYIIYVQRYGPPINGIFNQNLLAIIKSDLGIT